MIGKSKLHVNLLYSAPVHVKDTRVLLDGEPFLRFTDHPVDEYPPHVGSRSASVANGPHVLEVADANFGLGTKREFSIRKRTWVDIIIQDDGISVHFPDREPRYK